MNIHLAARVKKVLLAVGSMGIAVLVFASIASASATDNLSGYGWSSNIGWIKVNNCDTAASCAGPSYGLTMDPTTGNLSGYAWSSNIGWISFNADANSGCPTTPCQAHMDSTKNVTGWARACSVFASSTTGGCSGVLAPTNQIGGWEGWISLGNRNAAVPFGLKFDSTGTFIGCSAGSCAWGSDVVGWVDLSGVKLNGNLPETCTDGIKNQNETGVDTGGVCSPTVTLTANPNPVAKSGDTTVLTWTVGWPVVNAANQCMATGAWSGSRSINGGSQTSGAISAPTTFVITCSGPGGTGTAQVIVTVGAPTSCPSGQYFDPVTNACVNNPICTANQYLDPVTHQCVNNPVCPVGKTVDPVTHQCVTSGGGGDQCTNIAGTQTLPLPANYKQIPDGNGGLKCVCNAGYVMNASYQCVKPVFQEH